jgi:hypothetical protein
MKPCAVPRVTGLSSPLYGKNVRNAIRSHAGHTFFTRWLAILGSNDRKSLQEVQVSEQRQGYIAYLLRLWRVRRGETWSWRASLERVGADERKGFVGLEGLFAFLCEQTGRSQETEQSDSSSETDLPNAVHAESRRLP